MLLLVGAMTVGALTLLALEGKPIQPMPFSLASQSELSSLQSALGTEAGVEPGRWQRIEIAYRAGNLPVSDAAGISGELALRYHFVITGSEDPADARIFASHRWTQQLACLNPTQGPYDARTIRVCLLTSDPETPLGSARQNAQLESLIDHLVRHCQIRPRVIWSQG